MQALIEKLDGLGNIVTTMQRLPSGVAGTQKTLALMHESIIAAIGDETVRTAAFIAAEMPNRAATAREEVRRVQLWVQRNIRYVLDPAKVELLQAPAVTMRRRQGDCDDQTTLLCSLLSVLGHQTRMIAVGFKTGSYAHVLTEVNIDGVWQCAETIKPWPLGQAPQGVQATMRMVVNIGDRNEQLSGWFSAIKRNVFSAVKHPLTLIKHPIRTINQDFKRLVHVLPAAASGFSMGGPWGALAAAVVSDVSTTKKKMDGDKLNLQARAAFELEARESGAKLAEAGGQPQRSTEFSERIRLAVDPTIEIEKIISEFQNANIAKNMMMPIASEAEKTKSIIGGSTLAESITANKLPIVVAAGVLVLVLALKK